MQVQTYAKNTLCQPHHRHRRVCTLFFLFASSFSSYCVQDIAWHCIYIYAKIVRRFSVVYIVYMADHHPHIYALKTRTLHAQNWNANTKKSTHRETNTTHHTVQKAEKSIFVWWYNIWCIRYSEWAAECMLVDDVRTRFSVILCYAFFSLLLFHSRRRSFSFVAIAHSCSIFRCRWKRLFFLLIHKPAWVRCCSSVNCNLLWAPHWNAAKMK